MTDVLPEGTELISTRANRGTGCTGSSTLTCGLDVLSGDLVAVIEIAVRSTRAGSLVNTAVASALESDPDPTNNRASLTITAAPPASTLQTSALEAPRLAQRGTPTVKVMRSRPGSLSRIATLVRVDTKATVTLRVRSLRTGKLLTLQSGSRLAEMTLDRPATSARTRIAGARAFAVKVLLPFRQRGGGRQFQLELTAVSVNGKTTRLAIAFSR